ncbi:hypothetical protein BU24DRAFT_466560 [Aaosphaeria arxii CBS 175.79]|uniref:Uncharacterized protein n=1 Tax=Aaosphaeria arxii CBS 175.79 TaxID=1450172 RepID=A0A6A5XD32_9PLEO|nr:uncharacterized protein BU24DRAFT_466560 [Aaosphaeria arxii CBS 175.79]KAF2010783.1 hypothetical protein BU24DRAFT_466560 [Aaosphaeria arxii CBS 175.79]
MEAEIRRQAQGRQTEEWVRHCASEYMPRIEEASSEPTTPTAVLPSTTQLPLRTGEKRPRAPETPAGPYIHPLPSIETIMSSPNMSRPVYNSLTRGEQPPAQTYKTVIHTPKPANLRILDQNLVRAAESQALQRRRRRANSGPGNRSRSNTGSSIASSEASTCAGSSVGGDFERESSASEVSDVDSCKATAASSPAFSFTAGSSPRYTLFPQIVQSTISLPIASSVATSPALSFHSTHSNFSPSSSTPNTPSERGTPSSQPSSAYPSPPASPIDASRRSSTSEEYMAYPSPPASPSPAPFSLSLRQRLRNNNTEGIISAGGYARRRGYSFPPPKLFPSPHVRVAPPPPAQPTSTSTSTSARLKLPLRPRMLARSVTAPLPTLSSSSSPSPLSSSVTCTPDPDTSEASSSRQKQKAWQLEPLDFEGVEFDLGEQKLGGGGIDSPTTLDSPPSHLLAFPSLGEGGEWGWSMNGGELVSSSSVGGGKGVGTGRLMGGSERESDWGLGLYVIDEEREEDERGDRSPVRKSFRR